MRKSLSILLIAWSLTSSAQMMLPAYQGAFSRKIVASGIAGNGLDFDGVNDYVSISNGYAATNEVTYEAWVYTQFNSNFQSILDHNNYNTGAIHFQFSGSTLQFDVNGADNNSCTFSFSQNTWYHLAVAYSKTGGYIKFYVNGTLTNTINKGSMPTIAGSQAISMGAWAGGRFFKGIMDEVRIWNVARSIEQIQANMNKELLGTEAGLVAYYTFNQGIAAGNNTAITTVTDKTANAINGTLTNFTKTGATSNFVVGKVVSPIITNDLLLNLDASNTASYPGSGTLWADLSGNINNATLVNGVAYNSANGGSLVFDGSDDYADITSNSLGSATVLTIEGFVKWVSGTGGMFFGFTTYDVWTQSGTLGYNNGGSNVIGISAAKVSSLNLVGNWHHYTFVMKSTGLLSTNKIYIDGVDMGVLTPVVANDGNIPGLNNNLRLCSWNNGGFHGNMQYANLRIYNRELTASEINQNYNASKSRFGL
jgi:hypothetical protein